VDAAELPTLLKKIDLYDGSHFVRLALQMMDELWERRRNNVWVFPGERSCPYMNKNSMTSGQEREKHLTKPTREIHPPMCIIAQLP
jgi:hypothetical protein